MPNHYCCNPYHDIGTFILSYLFYERLYVDQLEQSLIETGKLLAQDYQSGPLSEELRQKIA